MTCDDCGSKAELVECGACHNEARCVTCQTCYYCENLK